VHSIVTSSQQLDGCNRPVRSPFVMVALPFDAHNHIQLGPIPVLIRGAIDSDLMLSTCVRGMAVMSTHPRDYPKLLEMERASMENIGSDNGMVRILPCLGVHPWFLHELGDDEWAAATGPADGPVAVDGSAVRQCPSPRLVPKWVADLEQYLLAHPHLPVGEIGLDNFHFDPVTKELTTPMDRQAEAFRYQLQLATTHRRPVSIHCVRAMGRIMDAFNDVYNYEKQHQLPPRIYFHAFGGKAATVTQLVQTLERKRNVDTRIYFGFAPIVNFQSPKTVEVIQAVGLDRLVLETDHEDVRRIGPSMKVAVECIADALSISHEELIQATNENVKKLYNLQ
jgi:Tat protein secretion system quality control protein TatD with DNase activity